MRIRIMNFLLFAISSTFFSTMNAQEKPRFSFTEEFGVDFDELAAGPRINYMQGKDGFLGLAFNVGWHETEYVPSKHIGFAIGSDFKLSKSFLMAPKVVLEYRYYLGILRLGYLYYTDFGREADHRLSAEIGFSFLSFGELSYVHTFGFNNNPFNLGSDYFNLTISIPVIMKTL